MCGSRTHSCFHIAGSTASRFWEWKAGGFYSESHSLIALQAHYIEKGKLFDTFCGTLEYCAPEVLLGNPYAGKELDMFALGVTLFTLVFGERPFFDVEETIAGVLCPPFEVNELCSSALLWILDCDPKKRATAQEMMTTVWVTKVDHPSS